MKIFEISSAFQRWFSGSKIVDSSGKPLIVYHGTNQSFEKFDKSKGGRATNAASAHGVFWFTDSPVVADEYAQHAANYVIADADTTEAKSAEIMTRMTQAERRGDWDLYDQLNHELEELELGAMNAEPTGQNLVPVYLSMKNPLIIDATDYYSTEHLINCITQAKENGNDGVIFKNLADTPYNRISSTQFVVFKPSQIKSIFSI